MITHGLTRHEHLAIGFHAGGCYKGAEVEAALESLLAENERLRAERDDAQQQLEVLRPGGLYAWKSKYEALRLALAGIREEMEQAPVLRNHIETACNVQKWATRLAYLEQE
jgi:hypothetical protein